MQVIQEIRRIQGILIPAAALGNVSDTQAFDCILLGVQRSRDRRVPPSPRLA